MNLSPRLWPSNRIFKLFLWAAIFLPLKFSQACADELQIGQPPPVEVQAFLSSGDIVSAGDYRGRNVLVVYWSFGKTYSEMEPQLRELRHQYVNNDNFIILSIYMDNDWEKWMKYLKDAEPLKPNPYFYDDHIWWQAFTGQYDPPKALVDRSQLPVAHLLSRDGKFRAINIPLKDIETTVEKCVPIKKKAKAESK